MRPVALSEADVGYELLLRSPAPDKPVLEEALREALIEALQAASLTGIPVATSPTEGGTVGEVGAVAPAPEGKATWSLPNCKGLVEARLSRGEGGALRGVDFDVPFGGTEDELRSAFLFVIDLCERLQLVVFDPQLACQIGRGSIEAVTGRWNQSRAWMRETVGVFDDPRSLAPIEEPAPMVTRGNKILLVVVGVIVFLLWLLTSLTPMSSD